MFELSTGTSECKQGWDLDTVFKILICWIRPKMDQIRNPARRGSITWAGLETGGYRDKRSKDKRSKDKPSKDQTSKGQNIQETKRLRDKPSNMKKRSLKKIYN